MPKLTQQQLETHLWGAANILRGRTAGQDYKTYILSLMFFKRLSDQWDHEATEKIADMERERGKLFTDAQRDRLLASRDIHRFTLPDGCHWEDVRKVTANVGQVLTRAMRGIADANDELRGVFTVDWNQPAPDGEGKLIANEVVLALVNHFHAVNLSNARVQADVLGRAYEYLIKQFADDAGAKAKEFFTPPEVVDILIRILEPKPGETAYDPTCGSGGMLVHSADFLNENGHGTCTASTPRSPAARAPLPTRSSSTAAGCDASMWRLPISLSPTKRGGSPPSSTPSSRSRRRERSSRASTGTASAASASARRRRATATTPSSSTSSRR
jgi:type I restriction enzyme M protein